MIKYSVVIPLYNMERYIEQCVTSINSQHRKDVEIIIVNDGSIDDSLRICIELKNRYGNINIIDKQNSGSMDSWMMGVDCCSGEYICFVDSDDFVVENYFSVIDEYLTPDVDILLFDCLKYSKNSKHICKVNDIPYGFVSEKMLDALKKDYFSCYKKYSFYRWNKVYKSSLLKECIKKIDFRLTYFEDLYIGLLTLQMAKNILYINEVLYNYRLRKSSVTHTVSPKVFDDNLLMEAMLKKYMTNNSFAKRAIGNMQEYMNYGYVRYYLRTKTKPQRIRVSFQMMVKNPHKSHNKLFLIYKFRCDVLFMLLLKAKNKISAKDDLFE